ncbi:MAG TPA: aminopeptidase P family protein [Streptosporangiaceae bacterium]|jgi:Xaa-Pro aminopeptidase
MPEMHAARRDCVQVRIAALGADAALITHLPNVRYLTGLASSNAALLLPATGDGMLATDSRYALAAERDCPDLELLIERFLEAALGGQAVRRGYRKLLVETQEMTVARYQLLERAAEGVELAPFGNTVEELRAVKDEAELELLAEACRISSQAIEDVLPAIKVGITERELATVLERQMVDLGAEKVAFDTIVASGPNGAIPHHSPGKRMLQHGDLVTIDFGALYGGYHADMTRTVSIGEPAQWQRDIYDLVARAQQAGIDAARPGAEIAEVDAAARDMIEAAGHGGHFQHGLGHGVGLEVHEAPMLGYGRTGRLAARVPVTIEPGVYLPGQGGVRIEDVLVVGADGDSGFGGLLTTTTRELLAL